MKHSVRKGFTLVELLIVIVVIGVLSAMMMLSSTEAVSSARASNIISNLRNLKTAALSFYTSSLDQLTDLSTAPTIGNVTRYLNNEGITDDYKIAFKDVGNSNKNYDVASWYITCHVTDTNVRNKLKARASSVGLLVGGSDGTKAPSSDTTNYNGEEYVAIKVR